ncbi:MAG: toxin TcdB middle/N-terminal domain-containing protein [Candidatus Woesearchaeota archaeon]|nr:toxin TcdB middle/N-terminal domain-containing protein [Candidatus Woesearchaeota archaeon]
MGGITTLDYKKIASLDNTGNDNINDLGFNGWVVNTIENNNNIFGTQNTISTHNISYENGMFDPDERQFAGFAYVEETRNQKTKIRHNFFQDKGKRGLEYETEILNTSNNLFKKIQNEFTSTYDDEYYVNTLLWTINSLYDESVETPSQTKIQFGYDNYGNIISTSYLGDTSKTGDEKYLYNEYLYNTDNWIIDLPKHTYLLESDDSTKVSETWYSYDSNGYNENPTRGDITSIEYWLDIGTNPVETYHYDTYGNVLTYTNPLSHSTHYTYGSNNTFIIRETNAIGHETNYEYDKGTGNILSETDPNGIRIEYHYDVFGRKVKEILPYDSIDYPSIQIEYNLDGTAPEEIKVMNREQSGTTNTFDTYFYYDGFWRLIQKKSESEQQELITSDIYYDKTGKIKQESNPYYSSTGYTIPNENMNSITYTYDTLGRITQTDYPDGSAENIVYNNWTTLIYDQNNNIKEYEHDAYDRTTKVKEHNNNEIYTTSYFYDDNDNLIKILDNQDNFIQYEYDSLSRKIGLDDMDLGIWSYIYDTIGNLITQTDNKGNIIHLTYDQLNRITHKEFSEGDITYTYDVNTLGTLTSIQTPTLLRNFWYDNKFRKIREEKVIDGTSFDTLYSYDSMDRLISKTLPNEEIINYEYNDQSLLESIPSIINNIDYNEMSQTSTRNYANNLDTQFEYEPYNYRLHEISTENIQELEYSYDNIGNVLQTNDIMNNKISEFEYDDLHRLTHAQRPSDFDIHYIYDSIGNLLDISSERLNATFYYNNGLAHTPIMINDKSVPLLTIPLEKEWNLISIPLVLEENTFPKTLLSLTGKYTTIFAYNSSENTWDSYYTNQPSFLNSIDSITPEKGYWIEMIENATLTIPGDLPTSTVYNLYNGWNLISYPSLTEQPIASTLANVNETFTTIFTFNNNVWESYSPNKPSFLNTLQTMKPGYGYWIKANQNVTWQFNGTHYNIN